MEIETFNKAPHEVAFFWGYTEKRYSEQKLICDLVHSQIEENSIAIIVLPIVKCMA